MADVVFMVKPLGLAKEGVETRVRQFIASHGGTVIQEWRGAVDPRRISEHYRDSLGKPFGPALVKYLVGRDVLVLRVRVGEAQIPELRALLGPSSVKPGTLRGELVEANEWQETFRQFGAVDNALHLSDSPEAGRREVGVWFGVPEIQSTRPETVKQHERIYTALREIEGTVRFGGSNYNGTSVPEVEDDLDYQVPSDDIDATVARIAKDVPGAFLDTKEGRDPRTGTRYAKLEVQWEGGKADIAVVDREAYRNLIHPNVLALFMPQSWKDRVVAEKRRWRSRAEEAKAKHGKGSPEAKEAKSQYENVKRRAYLQTLRRFGAVELDKPMSWKPYPLNVKGPSGEAIEARLAEIEAAFGAKHAASVRVAIGQVAPSVRGHLLEWGMNYSIPEPPAALADRIEQMRRDGELRPVMPWDGVEVVHGIRDVGRRVESLIAERRAAGVEPVLKADIDGKQTVWPTNRFKSPWNGYMDALVRFEDGTSTSITVPEMHVVHWLGRGAEINALWQAVQVLCLDAEVGGVAKSYSDELEIAGSDIHFEAIEARRSAARDKAISLDIGAPWLPILEAGKAGKAGSSSLRTPPSTTTGTSTPSVSVTSQNLAKGVRPEGSSEAGSIEVAPSVTSDSIDEGPAEQEKQGEEPDGQGPKMQALAAPAGWPERTPIKHAVYRGNPTTIRLANGKTLHAVYVLHDVYDAIPSHDPLNNFAENKAGDRNERPYQHPTQGAAPRATVNRVAADPDKRLLLSNTQTPTDGPPQVTTDLRVPGGNARLMGEQLAYSRPAAADLLRRDVEDAAKGFGFTQEQVDAIPHPVISRMILDDVGPPGQMSRVLNESMTTGRTADTDAVSRGSKLTKEHADRIARTIGGGTIREALADPDRSAKIVRTFVTAGAFSESDLVEYRNPDGSLNEAGKVAIEKAILGAAVTDVGVLAETAPAVRQKLARAIGSIVRLNQSKAATGFDFADTLLRALEAAAEYRESGARSMDDMLSQTTMTPQPWRGNPRAVALAGALLEMPQQTLTKHLYDVGRAARAQASGQATLSLGQPRTAVGTFDELFGVKDAPAVKAPEPSAAPAAPAFKAKIDGNRVVLLDKDGKEDGRAWVTVYKNPDGKFQPIGNVAGGEQEDITGEGIPTSNFIKARVKGREWLLTKAATLETAADEHIAGVAFRDPKTGKVYTSQSDDPANYDERGNPIEEPAQASSPNLDVSGQTKEVPGRPWLRYTVHRRKPDFADDRTYRVIVRRQSPWASHAANGSTAKEAYDNALLVFDQNTQPKTSDNKGVFGQHTEGLTAGQRGIFTGKTETAADRAPTDQTEDERAATYPGIRRGESVADYERRMGTTDTKPMFDAAAQPPAPAPAKPAGFLSNLSAEKQARAEAIKARLRAKLNTELRTGIDPEMMSLGAELGAYYFEAGVKRFAVFARQMVAEIGNGIKPYLRAIYAGARQMPGVDRAGTDSADYVDTLTDADVEGFLAGVTGPEQGGEGGRSIADQEPTNEAPGGGLRDEDAGGNAGGRTQQTTGYGSGGDRGSSQGGMDAQPPADATGQPGGGGGVATDVADAGSGGGGVGAPDSAAQGGSARGDETGRRPEGGGGSGVGDAAGAIARRQSLPPEARNYIIKPGEEIAPKGDAAKYAANVKAIELLKAIEADGDRFATPDEKSVLARYTGWGWGGTIFDESNDKNASRRKRLRDLLTDDEYGAARASITNAHYTSDAVVRPMWDLVRRLGFSGGRVLEPGAGSGNFFGMMPEDLAAQSSLVGVELDSITGRILRKLYPEADVRVDGFEKTRLANNSFDIAIGNVPFSGSVKPFGSDYKDLLLHDYFFARALDKVKPGGLVVFITSDGTLNKVADGARVRGLFAEKADLVGAIRLPNNAFAENAGTEVTTDIIVFRKKDGRPFQGEQFIRTAKVGEWPTEKLLEVLRRRKGKLWDDKTHARFGSPEQIEAADKFDDVTREIERLESSGDTLPVYSNEYFAKHPEMALGTHSLAGTMYSAGDYALVAKRGQDLGEALNTAIARLPANVMGSAVAISGPESTLELRSGERLGAYLYRPGEGAEFFVMDGENAKPADWLTEKMMGDDWEEKIADAERARRVAVAKAWFPLRDAARALSSIERSPSASEREVEAARSRLNREYADFVEAHGTLNHPRQPHRNPAGFLQADPDYYLVQSLEVEKKVPVVGDKAGDRKASKREKDMGYAVEWVKHPIFTTRQSSPNVKPSRASSTQDAAAISMAYLNRIDPEEVGGLLGIPADEAKKRVLGEGLAFVDPIQGTLEPKDKYLSGNVRRKLREARVAAEADKQYAANVSALEAVQPKDVSIGDISMSLSSRWVPAEVSAAFASEFFGTPVETRYSRRANGYEVTVVGESPRMTNEFGIRYGGELVFNGKQALQLAMDGGQARITVTEGFGPNKVVRLLKNETHAAQQLVNRLAKEFEGWSRTTRARVTVGGVESSVQDALARTYNEQFNGTIPINYDGSYLALPGMTKYVRRVPHRLSVVARILQERCAVMAHGVGSGKTLALIVSAMELRRLGIAKKPMIVVQKATVGQFATAFRRAYPHAKILVANEKTFSAKNRKRLMAQASLGDWDAIVVTQPQFERIKNKPERIRAYIEGLVDLEREALEEEKAKSSGRRSLSQKRIEDKIKALENKLESLMESMERKTDAASVYFQDLGIDFLMIDEAHAYKNAPITTRRQNVKGIPTGFSLRAINTKIKAEEIQQFRGDGTGIVLATGTPITNTMAEAYVMLATATPNALREYGIENFDEFANTFGRMETKVEYTWAQAYRAVTRFIKLMNGGELVNLIRSGFDVKMGNKELGLQVPEVTGGRPEIVETPATPAYADIADWLLEAADIYESMEPREKREYSWVPITIMQTGMAAALDPRLVDPAAEDHPDSKVNTAARRIAEVYRNSTDIKGTQIVFMDRFSPMNTNMLRGITDPSASPDDGLEPDGVDVDASDLDESGAMAVDADAKEAAERKAADDAEKAAYSGPGFNLYRDLKAKLVAQGIPENEIAVINDYATDQKRTDLFEKVNTGTVRVLIGSTDRVGVGVNVQARLVHGWHLDPPRQMTPAMLEQRRGRYIRQDNLFASETIDGAKNPHYIPGFTMGETFFGVAKSQDTTIYQLIENKLGFITQYLMGKVSQREFDDPADQDLANAAALRAQLTGDTRAIRAAELDQEIRELSMEKAAWEQAVVEHRTRLEKLPQDVAWRESFIAEQERVARTAERLAESRRVTVGMSEADNEKDAKELLKAKVWGELAADMDAKKALVPKRSFVLDGTAAVEVSLAERQEKDENGKEKTVRSYEALVMPPGSDPKTKKGTFTIRAPSPGAFFGGLARYAEGERAAIPRYQQTLDTIRSELAAAQAQPEPTFTGGKELADKMREHATLERQMLESSGPTKKSSHGLFRGQRVMLPAGRATIFSVRESNSRPGTYKSLRVKYDGDQIAYNMLGQEDNVIAGAKAYIDEEARKKRGAVVRPGEPSRLPGRDDSMTARLDRLAGEAMNRIRNRRIGRGATVGATTLIDDTLDLGVIVATKSAAAGIRAGQKLTAIVTETIAKLRADGTIREGKHHVDEGAIRRVAKKLLRDAEDHTDGVLGAYAAAREAIDKSRTRRVGKAVGDAAAVRAAVADDVRDRPEVTRPGDNREARLQAQVVQGPNREAGARAAGERSGFRQGMDVGEARGERKTRSRAAREILRARRQSYRDGLHTGEVMLDAAMAVIARGRKRMVEAMNLARRGGQDEAKARQDVRDAVRQQVVDMAAGYPQAVRGALVAAIAKAETPLEMYRIARQLAARNYRSKGRALYRAIERRTRPSKVRAMKGRTDAAETALATIRAEADQAIKVLRAKGVSLNDARAAVTMLDRLNRDSASEIVKAKDAHKQISRLRGLTAMQLAEEVATAAEKNRATVDVGPRAIDPPDTTAGRLRRKLWDLRRAAAQIEGQHGTTLRDVVHTRTKAAESEKFDIERRALAMADKVAQDAGFNGLDDAADAMNPHAGEGVVRRMEVQIDGKKVVLTLGEALALYGHGTDPETLGQIISSDQAFTTESGKGTIRLVPSPGDLIALRLALEQEQKGITKFIDGMRQINDQLWPRARDVVRRLTGTEPVTPVNRYPRPRLIEDTPADKLPETGSDFVQGLLERDGGYTTRLKSTLPIILRSPAATLREEIHKSALVIAMAEPIRDAFNVLAQERLKRAVVARHGLGLLRDMKRQLVAVYADPKPPTTIGRAVRFFNSNGAVTALAFNPGAYILNSISFIRLAPDLRPSDYAVGMASLATRAPSLFRDLKKRSGFFWDRYARSPADRMTTTSEATPNRPPTGFVRALVKMAKNSKSADIKAAFGNLRDAIHTTMQVYNLADAPVAIVAYAALIRESEATHPGWRDSQHRDWAAKRAEALVSDTQPTHSLLDAAFAPTESRGTAESGVFLFQSDNLRVRNRISVAYRTRGAKYGTNVLASEATNIVLGRLARRAAWYPVAVIIAAMFGLDDDDWKRLNEEYWGWARLGTDVLGDAGNLALPFGWRYIMDAARGFSPTVLPAPGPEGANTAAGSVVKAVRTIYEDAGKVMDGNARAQARVASAVGEAINEGMSAFFGNPLAPIVRRVLRELRK